MTSTGTTSPSSASGPERSPHRLNLLNLLAVDPVYSATSTSPAMDATPDLSADGSTFVSPGLTNSDPSDKPECR
jgi:hypothetical protein